MVSPSRPRRGVPRRVLVVSELGVRLRCRSVAIGCPNFLLTLRTEIFYNFFVMKGGILRIFRLMILLPILLCTTGVFADAGINDSCIIGIVMDPKSEPVPDAKVTIKDNLTEKEYISTQTNQKGEFKLCAPKEQLTASSQRSLSVLKKGFSSAWVSYDRENIQAYIDTNQPLNVYITPWFLERNVTISAYFSDIPDCKIANGTFFVTTYDDPMNSTEGCKKGNFNLDTESDDNWHLDCFYPGMTISYQRIHPIKPNDSVGGTVFFQHPGLFDKKQVRGKNGTDYTIGTRPTNPDNYADYHLTGGVFDSNYLKKILNIQVDTKQITRAQADEYWRKALKNCPDANSDTNDQNSNSLSVDTALEEAKAREQSFANRAVTAASTAATGIGAMAAASAIAEQRADAEAEKEMRAYIETMKCEYGNGQNVKLGNEEITLPGGNELLDYYTEYKQLADNLKTTKSALGLRSGIESEVLYDRAQSGLYQYASIGKTGGAETSLYRALTDKESEDASTWAEQKEKTDKKLLTGGLVAAAGVATGVIGNYLVNERGNKNDTNETDIDEIAARAGNALGRNRSGTEQSDETNPTGRSSDAPTPVMETPQSNAASTGMRIAADAIATAGIATPANSDLTKSSKPANTTANAVEQWKNDFRKNYLTYEITNDNYAKQFDFIEGDDKENQEYKRLEAECDKMIAKKERYQWYSIPGAKQTIGNVEIKINRYLCGAFY